MQKKSLKFQRLTVFLAVALFTLGACSSEDTSESKNNASNDTSLEDVQENDGSDADKAKDTEEGDDVSGGSDTDLTGDVGKDADPKTDVDPEKDVEEVDPDAYPEVDPVDCAYPSDDESCPQGDFGAATFLTEFKIVEDSSCCYDFTGDGKLDNYLGSLIKMFKNLPGFGDVNANINAAINLGELVYLFEFADLEHPKFDSDLRLTVYEGRDSDDDFGPNLVGAGDFEVLPHSYELPGVPKWKFEKARVHNGELLATGGRLRIGFPGMLDEIILNLEEVRVRAKIVQDAGKSPDLTAGGRVWLTQGELAGALHRDTLFSSLNEAAKGCECIQDTPDKKIYGYDATKDTYTCEVKSTDSSRCTSESAECQSLTDKSVCGLLAELGSQVDVDTDADGKPDSFSIGARFEATGASIVGISE